MSSLMFEILNDKDREQSNRRIQIHSRVSMHKEEIEEVTEMLVEWSQTEAKQKTNQENLLTYFRIFPTLYFRKKARYRRIPNHESKLLTPSNNPAAS